MRVILIEPAPIDGHRPIYVRSITETASSGGRDVRRLTTEERAANRLVVRAIRNLPGVRSVGELRSIPEVTMMQTLSDRHDCRRRAWNFAGRQEAEVAERMKSGSAVILRSQNRLFELNRFLSDEEEALVFSA